MAFFDASKSRFSMTDSGGSLRDISAGIVGIDGLPGVRNLLPATTINDTGYKSHPGIQGPTVIRLELLYDDTALTGSHVVFSGLFADTTVRAFKYGPEGSASADVAITGSALLRLMNEPTRVGNMVGCIVELEVQGVISFTTWGA